VILFFGVLKKKEWNRQKEVLFGVLKRVA